MEPGNNRMVVRGEDGSMEWSLSDWTALVALAALSADPVTLSEFATAVRRYCPEHDLIATGRFHDGLSLTGCEGQRRWCLVDLVGRTVLASRTFELPARQSAFQNDELKQTEQSSVIWLDLSRDWEWQTVDGATGSVGLAPARSWLDDRFQEARRRSRRDAREVLYGPPWIDYLATAMLEAKPRRQGQATASWQGVLYEYDLTQAIHRDWMLTPRNDLAGRTPRSLLLADRERLSSDLEHRAEQWSRQRFAPPPLATSSYAYRFANFGTCEIAIYFRMTREAMNEAWQWIDTDEDLTVSGLRDQLAAWCDQWLVTVDPGEDELTPQEQIDLERQRLPRQVQPHEMFDDCPLCRVQAEGIFGPTFMWYDGHHLELEDDFAFSLVEDYRDWEDLRNAIMVPDGMSESLIDGIDDSAVVNPTVMANGAPSRSELAASEHATEKVPSEQGRHVSSCQDEATSVWNHCLLDGWDEMLGPNASGEMRRLALGFPLSELAEDLGNMPGGEPLREALNDSYVEFSRMTDPLTVDSAANRLRGTLESIAQKHPELVTKSADLQGRLDEIVRAIARSS